MCPRPLFFVVELKKGDGVIIPRSIDGQFDNASGCFFVTKSLRDFDGFACVAVDLNRLKVWAKVYVLICRYFIGVGCPMHPNRGVRFFD